MPYVNKRQSVNFGMLLSGIGVSAVILGSLLINAYQFSQPALGQSSNSTNATSSTTTGTLSLSITVANNPITRGSPQTLRFITTDTQSHQAVAGAQITGTVMYASGLVRHLVGGPTDPSGTYSETWTIGGNSNPGTFTVKGQAAATGYSMVSNMTTFQVTSKGG